MKTIFVLLTSFFLSVNGSSNGLPATMTAQPGTVVTVTPGNGLYEKLASLKIKEIEKLLGRKLKLKEKIAVKVYQWRIKKGWRPGEKSESSEKGKTAFILGLVAIGTLLIPYAGIAAIPCAILAIIFGNQAKKENPHDSKAKTGVILGWVTLGLTLLAFALIIAILASWTWR